MADNSPPALRHDIEELKAKANGLKSEIDKQAGEFHRLLRNAPWQQNDTCIKPQDSSRYNEPRALSPSPADSNKPHKASHNPIPRRKFRTRAWRWAKRLVLKKDRLERGAYLAAIVYAVITWHQWHDAGENFIKDERPFVWVKYERVGFDPDTTLKWNVAALNYGKTPAIHVRMCLDLITANASMKDIGKEKTRVNSRCMSNPMGIIPPNNTTAGIFETAESIAKFNAERMAFFKSHDDLMAVAGWITYDDLVGRSYRTEFCGMRSAGGQVHNCSPDYDSVQ